MNEEFDEGALIFNDFIPIHSSDTYGTLATKLSAKAAQVALNLANMLEYATVIPSNTQNESEARYFEFPTLEDTLVNWKNMSAMEITALINACNPWNSGADAYLNNELIQIVSANCKELIHTHVPGTILGITYEGQLEIACFNNSVLLIEIIKSDLGLLPAKKYAEIAIPYNKYIQQTSNETLN
jgi:methionyl-tRNA formyltransferase